MTIIETNKKSIYVHGHSGYGTYGNDIVCAAISTLTEATYNYLEATNNQVHNYCDDGEFTIILDKLNKNGKQIVEKFKEMIKDLESQYPKNIEMREK